MATVSPNPSDREIIDGVCGGKITPEKAVELLRGDGTPSFTSCRNSLAVRCRWRMGVGWKPGCADRRSPGGEARPRAPPRATAELKVSAKGALSVYGLQRMPVTLYVEQWERLLAVADDIRKFAKEHTELNRKTMTTVGK